MIACTGENAWVDEERLLSLLSILVIMRYFALGTPLVSPASHLSLFLILLWFSASTVYAYIIENGIFQELSNKARNKIHSKFKSNGPK